MNHNKHNSSYLMMTKLFSLNKNLETTLRTCCLFLRLSECFWQIHEIFLSLYIYAFSLIYIVLFEDIFLLLLLQFLLLFLILNFFDFPWLQVTEKCKNSYLQHPFVENAFIHINYLQIRTKTSSMPHQLAPLWITHWRVYNKAKMHVDFWGNIKRKNYYY